MTQHIIRRILLAIPVILGILVIVGIIGLVLRVCLDVAQAVMDPRLRIQGGTR